MAAIPPTTSANLPDASDASPLQPPERDLGRAIATDREPQLQSNQCGMEMGTLSGNTAKCSTLSLNSESSEWNMSTKKEWIAIAACCWSVFSVGWNDATTGPLLPAFQAHYGVNFTVVSMLFVSNCVGFLSAAVVNIRLTDQLGLGKIILFGAMLQVLAYSLLAPALPFPVMCVAYAINGFGVGFQDAQANGFIAGLPKKSSEKMGLLHAVYGAGAFVSPLVATQFAQSTRLRRQHEITGQPDPKLAYYAENAKISGNDNKYKEIFSSRAVQLMSFFIWVYVGLEVTIGGWIVTFIIDERGGGPSSGYISSGFFGGLMLGRVVLLWVNKKIGERRVIYVYCILCIGLELVVWLVPHLVGNAVAVSMVGLLLGKPMYPIAMNVTNTIVPKRIITESIGWIASFGQAGSAVFPFMTGALAEKHSVKVMQPLVVGMTGVLIVLWTLIPRPTNGK
ncbi:major facilitator superfamily transporter [Rhizoctonia solani]|uniref:Major facilitator superfamily transporter n=1 Tax=Rhizoctonia solani TaxID=456999 RepID=A0A8H8NYZ0_9AGAM|nr:major facilitator superfamily transporter [Rhizoctonia solani]QRW20642.1 major facilitator superfamily transporter [Rhizoctonia solani]